MRTPRARKTQLYLGKLNAEGVATPPAVAIAALAQQAIESGVDLELTIFLGFLRTLVDIAPADFGLRFGLTRKLGDMGVVGHAIMSCETLRQALGIWSNFSNLAGDPLTYRSSLNADEWTNDLFPAILMPPAVMQLLTEEWAASFCHFAVETTGAACTDAIIEFRHARAPGIEYERLLPVTPQFGCRHNRITLPTALLDKPLLSRDDEMFDLLIQHFARERTGNGPIDTSDQLRHLFFTASGRIPKLKEAADMLGTSGRTLNRRLAAEGTSYAIVLAEYRSDYAQALVREGTLGAKQIAHAIGYRSHNSLRRAFSGWVGQPIGSWRATRGSKTD